MNHWTDFNKALQKLIKFTKVVKSYEHQPTQKWFYLWPLSLLVQFQSTQWSYHELWQNPHCSLTWQQTSSQCWCGSSWESFMHILWVTACDIRWDCASLIKMAKVCRFLSQDVFKTCVWKAARNRHSFNESLFNICSESWRQLNTGRAAPGEHEVSLTVR